MVDGKLKKAVVESLILLARVNKAIYRDRLYRQFARIRKQFYLQLWQEAARSLGAQIEDMGFGFYRITLGPKRTFVQGAEVMMDNHLALKIAGNKILSHRLLSERNYPVLRCHEYDLTTLRSAYDFMQKTGKACVVKPAESGASGKGITTNILTRKQLWKASLWASSYSYRLLVEEMLWGNSYRLLYLNGQYLDAVQRESPCVVGDGKMNVRQLIKAENQKRLNGPEVISLHPLTLDLETLLTLKGQGLQLSSIPAAGQRVKIKQAVNQNSRFENISVHDFVHPSIIKMGKEISNWMGVQLAGIDVMTPDISRPLQETGGVIGEINTKPALHHHYLIKDSEKVVPIAIHILNALLREI